MSRQYIPIIDMPDAQKTPELCLEAVRSDGMALGAVPDAMKTPEICLEAVRSRGYALGCLPDSLKTPELCAEAVRTCAAAICWVPRELKTPEMCLSAVKRVDALRFVPLALRTLDVCLAAVRRYPGAWEDVPDAIRPAVMRAAVQSRHRQACRRVPASAGGSRPLEGYSGGAL